MSWVITIVAFGAVIGALIFVHELGHFSTAKLFGVRVDEFGLGFPPRLFSLVRGETRYSLNVIPLGGFVRMPGENGATTDPRSFGAHPAWQRAIILAAGSCMNLLAAFTLFFISFAVIGVPQLAPHVYDVAAGSPAARVLRPGDAIIRVNGQSVDTFTQVKSLVDAHLGQSIVLTIRRAGHVLTVSLTPRIHPPAGQGALGVVASSQDTVIAPLGIAESAQQSIQEPVIMVQQMVQMVQQFFASSPSTQTSVGNAPGTQGQFAPSQPDSGSGNSGSLSSSAGSSHGDPNSGADTATNNASTSSDNSGSASLTGPIGILRLIGYFANQIPQQGIGPLLQIAALISANFAVLNMIPFPALDGGRLAFLAIAAVRRRGFSPEVEGAVHAIGMAVLLLLMIVISYQDLTAWISGRGL